MPQTKEIILPADATPVEDKNDRTDDEIYYQKHPVASGLPSMRYAGLFNPSLAHETGNIVLSSAAITIKDKNDRRDDENYYTENPIASGLPTMR